MTQKIDVRIQKSEIPIIWIDTSIINLMTQWKYGLGKLEKTQENRISKLYNSIHGAVSKGKLICPLAEQEGEVWVERNKWLNTIHSLALGIETEALFTIQHNQLRKFMMAYVKDERIVTLNYTDAFHTDPVSELREILKQPFFVSTRHPILFGEEYQKNTKIKVFNAMEQQRKNNIEQNIKFQEQLEKEYTGEFEALLVLKQRCLLNNFRDDNDFLNSTCGTIDLQQRLMYWENLTGKANDYEGLLTFFRSEYHKQMPYTNISCNIFAKLMTDKQPIRSGDTMDVKHAATLLPFADIYITDKAMSAFLRKRKFDTQYQTIVGYIGDEEIIDNFFTRL